MKRTNKSKTRQPTLGSLQELDDPEHLPKQRKKHRENETLDKYCEMLETQINSLVDKLLHQTKPKDLLLHHPESNSYFLGAKDDVEGHVQEVMTTRQLMEKLPELL